MAILFSVVTSVLIPFKSVTVVTTHCRDMRLIKLPTAVSHLVTDNSAIKMMVVLDIALPDESWKYLPNVRVSVLMNTRATTSQDWGRDLATGVVMDNVSLYSVCVHVECGVQFTVV